MEPMQNFSAVEDADNDVSMQAVALLWLSGGAISILSLFVLFQADRMVVRNMLFRSCSAGLVVAAASRLFSSPEYSDEEIALAIFSMQ
jgi:hypothetical protein